MYKSAIVGFSYLTGLICASLFGIEVDLTIGVLAAIGAVVLFLLHYKSAAAAFAFVGAGFISMALFVCLNYAPIVCASGTETTVTGTFLEKTYAANDTGCFLIEAEINGVKTKLSIFGEDADAEYGDAITAKVRLSSFAESDYATRAYYLSRGIFLRGFALSGITVVRAENASPLKQLYSYRDHLLSRIEITLNGENGALVSAMFLGERDSLTASQKQLIKASGLSHMTAVSGLHLSVIVTLVMLSLDAFIKRRRLLKFVVLAMTLTAFMVLFKFTPSVMRASLMMFVYHSAPLFKRRADPLNSVGIALFIITAFSPFAAYDAGLMLSVSGTIGAGWLGRKISRRLNCHRENILIPRQTLRERFRAFTRNGRFYPEQPFDEERLTERVKRRNPFRDTIVSSVCALVCVLPLSAVYFGGISLWSVLSGLFIQPFFTVCLGAMVLFTFTGGVLNLLLLVAGLCAKAMNVVIAFFGSIDFGWLDLSYDFLPPLFLLTAVYLVVFFVCIRGERLRAFAVGFAALAVTVSVIAAGAEYSTISVMDVLSDGDGGAAVVSDGGRYTVIVADGGKDISSEIYCALKDKCVNTLDCLDLTRVNGGLSAYLTLARELSIKQVLISEAAAAENRKYNLFPNATICTENDTIIMTDNQLTIKDGITFMNLRGTTISVSEINEGDFRGGIAVMDGKAKELEIIGSINVYIDKKQKSLNAYSVNAYETEVRYYFKDGGLVAEDYS